MENQDKNIQEQEDEIDLREYWSIIKKRKTGIISIFSVAIIVAIIVSLLTPKTYTSSSLVKIGKFQKSEIQVSQLIESVKTTNEIIKQSVKYPFEIMERGELIEIKTSDLSSQKAKKSAQEITGLFISHYQNLYNEVTEVQKQEIDRLEKKIKENKDYLNKLNPNTANYSLVLLQAKAQIDTLEKELFSTRKELSTFEESKIISPASLPSSSSKPNIKLNIIIAAILGLFLGIFWAFSAEYLQNK